MFPDPSEPCTRLAPSQEPGRGIRERQGQLTRKQDGHIWTFMGRSPFQEKQKRVLLHRSSGFSGPGRQHQHPHKEDAPRLITQTARVPRPLSPRGRFLSVPESSALQRGKDCFQNYCAGRGTESWGCCSLSLVLEFLSPEQPDRSGVGV